MDIVLWPASSGRTGGFFYGWTLPLVCVAGILPFQKRQEAEKALELSVRLEHLLRVASLCGSPPVILGFCHGGSHQPKLAFFDQCLSHLNVVEYRRPNLGKLEIHTLHSEIPALVRVSDIPQGTAGLSPLQDRTIPHLVHDFTRPAKRVPRVFDQDVINQMNYGQLFEQTILNTAPKALLPLRDGVTQVGSLFARVATHSGRTSRIPQTVSSKMLQAAVKFISLRSAICQQISVRLKQLITLPGAFPTRTYDAGIVSIKATAEYVAYYNCVWLILNDIIIGWALGTFIRENATPMSQSAEYWTRRLLIQDLQWALLWLDSWPAGLKLNTELSSFLCHWLLGAVVAWNRTLDALILPNLEPILWVCGCTGCLGATIAVAFLADLLALLTAHVHACYVVLRTVYAMQLSVLGSLWNLFRGKRYNVLRKRVDSWAYDVDQLLFGTILFALLTFLFPTILTYYALFAMARLALLLGYALSDMLLVLINEFPLFALLLRAKDPFRLPGGVAYVLGTNGRSSHLQSEAISLASIFAHYGAFWFEFSDHYHPANLLRRLVTSTSLSHLTVYRSKTQSRST